MTASRHHMRRAALALLALTLARCSEESSPTGWIPRNGTISGVITVAGALFPGARPAAAPTAARVRNASFAPPQLASRLRPRVPTRPHVAFTPNDLIVTFRHTALGAPPVGAAALAEAGSVRALGGAIRLHLTAVLPAGARVAGVSPAILAAKIRVADAAERDAIAAALRQDPAIAAVTRNGLVWLDDRGHAFSPIPQAGAAATRTTPNDPFFPYQTWHYGLIDLQRAWSITKGSTAVLVAVVDDGIRFDHPGIAANLTSDGYDFVNAADSLALCAGGTTTNAGDGDGPDGDPTIPASYSPDIVEVGPDTTTTCLTPDDLGGHGLHVAGTIGAVGNDASGVTGVDWTVRIRPVRVLGVAGFGTDYDVAQGILYAAGLPADDGAGGTVRASTGAKIINVSLGGFGSDTTLHSAIISAAR